MKVLPVHRQVLYGFNLPTTCGHSSRRSTHTGHPRQRWHVQCAATSTKLTPHSGYHFDGSRRRFFEGWYFKVTLPVDGQSFALIYSIEDPGGGGALGGVGAQVMGPDDGYLLQFSRDINQFWADRDSLSLGACFASALGLQTSAAPDQPVTEAQFDQSVREGYQATLTWHQGAIVAREAGAAGDLPSTVRECRWAFSVEPQFGWGDVGREQKATAGWLAALPVFEPHWQVTMAHGLATGWLEWGGQRLEFKDAPSYAEKNWGGGFPSKWCWIQCNTFDGEPTLCVTAVGARRGLLNLPGVEEDVGLLGIHYQGQFIELVPWNGSVQWEVDPWGRWEISGRNGGYEAVLEARCERPGTPLRAPTAKEGLAPFCRDSFFGQVRMRVWQLDAAGERGPVVVDASSTTGAVEVGGGPWWVPWKAEAKMREPFKSLVKVPVDVEGLTSWLPSGIRPPGL